MNAIFELEMTKNLARIRTVNQIARGAFLSLMILLHTYLDINLHHINIYLTKPFN